MSTISDIATRSNYHPTLRQTNKNGTMYGDLLRLFTDGFWIDAEHYLHGPDVIRQPILPEANTQPLIIPDLSIIHTNAGPRRTPWQNLIAYWRRTDINGEAHMQIGSTVAVNAMPFNRRADCNYKANRYWKNGAWHGAISFECEDDGYPTLDQTPFNLSQLRHLIGTNIALCFTYGIWCTAPTSAFDSGIGYHSQFKEWSSFTGKTCPGAARIRQMDYIRNQVATTLAELVKLTDWKCGQR